MAAPSSRGANFVADAHDQRPKSNFGASHEIRWFDDHNTEAPHSALDTGAPDGSNFAAVLRISQ